ncbi:MAG: hypothetical protein DIJKHBIC_02181 [Thermoanaerobaculia bacterium]|nr:hypothetical protein [Thermoanaerobaculia bacterium]
MSRCSEEPCVYRDLFDAVEDILYVRDLDGVILEINEAGARFLGKPKEKIIGTTFHGAPVDDRAMSLMETNLALLENGTDRSTVKLTGADGAEHVFECRATLMLDPRTRTPAGAFGVMREITMTLIEEQRARLRPAFEGNAPSWLADPPASAASDVATCELPGLREAKEPRKGGVRP